jgi:hypothetical protein
MVVQAALTTSAANASTAMDDVLATQLKYFAEKLSQRILEGNVESYGKLQLSYKQQIEVLNQDIQRRENGCCLSENTNTAFVGIGVVGVVSGIASAVLGYIYTSTASLPAECNASSKNPISLTATVLQIVSITCTGATAYFLTTKRAQKGGIEKKKRERVDIELADAKVENAKLAMDNYTASYNELIASTKRLKGGHLGNDQIEATSAAFKKCMESYQMLPKNLKGDTEDSDMVIATAQLLPKRHPLRKAARRISHFVTHHPKSLETSQTRTEASEKDGKEAGEEEAYHAAIRALEKAGGKTLSTIWVSGKRYDAHNGEPSVVRPSVFVPPVDNDSDDEDEDPAGSVSVSAAGSAGGVKLSRTAGAPSATRGTLHAPSGRGAARSARPSVSAAAASASATNGFSGVATTATAAAADPETAGFQVVNVGDEGDE